MKISDSRILHASFFLVCFVAVAIVSAVNNVSVPAIATLTEKNLIVIDAGHGGADGGCVGVNGCVEKDINLAIAKNLADMLRASGFEVVMTRDTDVSIHDEGVDGLRQQKISDMENRLEIIKSYPDSVFISIHQNQYTSPEYFGGQMFYTTNNPQNFRLAQIMQEEFAQLQEGNDREIKLIDNGLFLFKDTQQPAILIECGFLSNEQDASLLSDSVYQKRVAFAIYKGLMRHYSDTKTTNVEITEELSGGKTADTLYMQ